MNKLVSEILTGIWLISDPNPSQLQKVADTILSGGFIAETKPDAYSVIGTRKTLSTGETELVDKVALISMVGIMSKYGGMCSYGADYFQKELLQAQDNPDILGIILKMDGPGGSAAAIPLFQEIKSQITKPVVAYVDMACSAHYWIAAMFAEHIMLSNDLTAEVGSIGVMVALSEEGKKVTIVRPDESADKNEEYIQALEGNPEPLKAKIAPLAIAFQNAVKMYRPKVKDEDIKGKTFIGQSAVDAGLADSIGTIGQAYNIIITKSNLK